MGNSKLEEPNKFMFAL